LVYTPSNDQEAEGTAALTRAWAALAGNCTAASTQQIPYLKELKCSTDRCCLLSLVTLYITFRSTAVLDFVHRPEFWKIEINISKTVYFHPQVMGGR
jgi:hypothetical protein